MVGFGGRRYVPPPDVKWRDFMANVRGWSGAPALGQPLSMGGVTSERWRRGRRDVGKTVRFAITRSGAGAPAAASPLRADSDPENSASASSDEDSAAASAASASASASAAADGEPLLLVKAKRTRAGCALKLAFGTRAQVQRAPFYLLRCPAPFPGAYEGCAVDSAAAWDAREKERAAALREVEGDPDADDDDGGDADGAAAAAAAGSASSAVVRLDSPADDEVCAPGEFDAANQKKGPDAALPTDIPRSARFRQVVLPVGAAFAWKGFVFRLEAGEEPAIASADDDEEKKPLKPLKPRRSPMEDDIRDAVHVAGPASLTISREHFTKSAAKK